MRNNHTYPLRSLFAKLLFGLVLTVSNAFGATIKYHVEDLADLDPGSDLKRFTYYVSDYEFPRNQGFVVFFESSEFSKLEVGAGGPNPDWDIIIGQPNIPPGFPGRYDALSIVPSGSIASLNDPFPLRVIMQGASIPDFQNFEINEYDEFGSYIDTLERGQAVRVVHGVPDGGSTSALLVAAWCGLALVRKFRDNQATV